MYLCCGGYFTCFYCFQKGIRLAELAQGLTRTGLYRSFEHTWHTASLRLASKQQWGHWHNLNFLMERCGTHCACWRLYGDLHTSNMSGCGRMQDKNSVYNVRIGSKSRAGMQDFFLLLWIMYHHFMSLLQTVCVSSS